jgi:hypothetical protein
MDVSPSKVAASLVVLIVTTTLSSGCVSQSGSGSGQQSNSSSASAQPTGSPVRDGTFEFQVLDITRAAQAGDDPRVVTKAQGEFIIVTLSVKNVGNKGQTFYDLYQKLIDSSGRQYDASNTADIYLNTDGRLAPDINPGISVQVKVAYDVPPGTVPSQLQLHDSDSSAGATVPLTSPR